MKCWVEGGGEHAPWIRPCTMPKHGKMSMSYFAKLLCVSSEFVLCLLITTFRACLQAKKCSSTGRKFYKASLLSCYKKMKYLALGLNCNIALSFSSCYNITIVAACLELYFTFIALVAMGYVLTYTYRRIYFIATL